MERKLSYAKTPFLIAEGGKLVFIALKTAEDANSSPTA